MEKMNNFEKAVLAEITTFGEAVDVLTQAVSEELEEAALMKMIELRNNFGQMNET